MAYLSSLVNDNFKTGDFVIGLKTITITKMSSSIFIKENKQNETYKTMKRIRLTESQLHNVIRKCINEAIDNEDKTQKAVDVLMSVRDVVSDAVRSFAFSRNERTPLQKSLIKASQAIEAIYGFSSYGDDLRQQRDIEMSEQD